MKRPSEIDHYTYRVIWSEEDEQYVGLCGEPVPEPICSRRYSGKLMVRIPPEVHRRLALEAAEEDISLNRLISTKLSS